MFDTLKSEHDASFSNELFTGSKRNINQNDQFKKKISEKDSDKRGKQKKATEKQTSVSSTTSVTSSNVTIWEDLEVDAADLKIGTLDWEFLLGTEIEDWYLGVQMGGKD